MDLGSFLGIDFDEPSQSEKTTLRVTNVHGEGMIAKHNANNPRFSVRRGDLIVQVNDESASALAMLKEIERVSSQKEEPLTLHIARRKFKRQVSFARSISSAFDEEKIAAGRGLLSPSKG